MCATPAGEVKIAGIILFFRCLSSLPLFVPHFLFAFAADFAPLLWQWPFRSIIKCPNTCSGHGTCVSSAPGRQTADVPLFYFFRSKYLLFVACVVCFWCEISDVFPQWIPVSAMMAGLVTIALCRQVQSTHTHTHTHQAHTILTFHPFNGIFHADNLSTLPYGNLFEGTYYKNDAYGDQVSPLRARLLQLEVLQATRKKKLIFSCFV